MSPVGEVRESSIWCDNGWTENGFESWQSLKDVGRHYMPTIVTVKVPESLITFSHELEGYVYKTAFASEEG